jgi:2,3-bisphosphoglycerate-dependent phosphoglycerate mutase
VAQLAELIVVRHGQSAANVAFAEAEAARLLDSGVAGRDADVELSLLGWNQATALGRWLAALPAPQRPEVVITSPYVRAAQTWRHATATATDLGAHLPTPSTDARLVDRLMGELELLTTAAVAARFPVEAARRLSDGEFRYRPPGGESFGDIADRLRSLLDDLSVRHAGQRVLLVAHDAIVLMARYVVEGLSVDELATIVQAGAVANASVTRFDGSSGQLRRDAYNMVDHLHEDSAPMIEASTVEPPSDARSTT